MNYLIIILLAIFFQTHADINLNNGHAKLKMYILQQPDNPHVYVTGTAKGKKGLFMIDTGWPKAAIEKSLAELIIQKKSLHNRYGR